MNTKEDGGPAFPSAFTNDGDRNVSAPDGSIVPPGFTVPMQGMTLRDYFAAKAMHAVMVGPFPGSHDAGDFARHAYEIADAMLAERAK